MRHARARGLVPNLTTSGLAGLEALLDIADHRVGPPVAVKISDHQRARRLIADDLQGIADPGGEGPIPFADQHIQRVRGVGKHDVGAAIAVEVQV